MNYAFRANQSEIYQSFQSPMVTAILGPRRVGKSTLVAEYNALHPDWTWVFLNMDYLEQQEAMLQSGLLALIETSAKQRLATTDKKLWVAIDEAQKYPELFDQIKVIYDQYKDQDRIKFIITGSATLELHRLSTESLAGRIEIYALQEFTLKESVELAQGRSLPKESLLNAIFNESSDSLKTIIDEMSLWKKECQTGLEEQLIWGGMPEVLLLTDEERRLRYLANYLQTYFERDVRAIKEISHLTVYRNLMNIVAEQTGSLRNDQKILQALDCSRDTLKKYRGYLSATLLYTEVFPFIRHSLSRLVKSPKGYLVSNGLVAYLTGIRDFTILIKSGAVGHRFENWMLKELKTALSRYTARSEVYYWRTTGDVEVDFVVEKNPKIYPFEITYSTKIQSKKLKHLKQFLAQTPQATTGYYIYMGDYQYIDGIHCIPAWAVS